MMTPGPVEEAGSTARAFMEAMKGQPAILALTIANFALLVFIFYALHSAAKFREAMVRQVLDNSSAIHEILKQRSISCPPCSSSEGERQWPGTEDKPHSSVTPLTNSRGTYVSWISQSGALQGWYCTIPLPPLCINGGTRCLQNKEW